MLIGYARTSTLDQTAGLDAQVRDLSASGCDKIFQEQVSSVDAERRSNLDSAIDFARDGDVLVVTKLDRLARSMAHLMKLTERLNVKGIGLRILDMNVDTSTAAGKLTLNLFGSIAQFEREIMLERQREGIAKAKAAGKYTGRKPSAMMKADDVKRLSAEGMGPSKIAAELGISRSSVYRALGS